MQFTDNTEQVINLKPVLAGELYGPLLDPHMCNRVSIDPEVKTIVCRRERTSIRPRCTIGLTTKKPLRLAPGNGNAFLRKWLAFCNQTIRSLRSRFVI